MADSFKPDSSSAGDSFTPESESFVQGFFKTYKGEPKTTLQKADVLAGKASNAVLKVANAPFEAATAPLETATAAMEGRPAEPLSMFGGHPSNPLSTVNKLLRAGSAALGGIPGGTALDSARTAYNAPRGAMGVAEDTAMGALLGAIAPEIMAAPVDTAIAGVAKTGKVVKDVASSLGKKAISTAFDVPEAAVAARFANPEAVKSAGTAENLALNDVPAVGDKFKQVISGLQDEAKKTLSTSKFLEPQTPTASTSPSGTEKFYHVTLSENLPDIQKSGIKSGSTGPSGEKFNDVYLSKSLEASKARVEQLAQYVDPKDVKIVEVNLPKSIVSKLKSDPEEMSPGTDFMYSGTIPSKYIQSPNEQIPGLVQKYPQRIEFTHDTPIENLKSIQKSGLTNSEEGHFATLGDLPESGFVSGKKASITFSVPTKDYTGKISPDMRYGGDVEQLLKENPDLKGADISVGSNVPAKYIKKVTVHEPGQDPKVVYENPNIPSGESTTPLDKGGAFTKDEVVGAIASAKRKLGGTWTAAGKTASKTLANLADSLKKATNTISQNQVHDYITKLDEEIPWTKVWKAPESLTLEDNAMIDVRTKLDGLLKDRNQEYAKIMEPLSDAINTRNEFLKKFALEKQKGTGKYEPSDTTTSRIKNATKENKLGTQRTLAKVKATTGEDLLPKIENAQTLEAFQPSTGPRGDTLYSSIRNTLSSPPMAARIIDMLSRGKTGVGNVLAAVNSQTEGTPLQDIIKRILQGQPALAPFIKGQQ